MPWRLPAFPIALGMLAHAARRALISVVGGGTVTGAFVACVLVSILATPVRSPASALRGCRPLRRCLFDAGPFFVQGRDGACRIGHDRAERACGSADDHRRVA